MSRQPRFALGVAITSAAFFGYQLDRCSQESPPPPPPRTDAVPIVLPEDVVEVSPVPVEDQLVECYDPDAAVVEYTPYLVLDGKVWLSKGSDGASRECVSDGSCHLGWYKGRLVHISRTPNLIRTELVDLGKREMDVVVDMTSLFYGQDLEPQLQPIIPCQITGPPIGVRVVDQE